MKIQNHFLLLVVIALSFVANSAGARILPMPVSNSMAPGIDKSKPISLFVVAGGILVGGKQNTCYLLRSRLNIQDRVSMDGSLYHHFNQDNLYTANIGLGGVIVLNVGAEWGDRRYYINRDSTLEHIKFKNVATGNYEPYSSFADFSIPQEVTSFNLGIGFNTRMVKENFWRGQGQSFTLIYFKFEMMYAPKVEFDKMLDIVVQGPYQEETSTYELEGAKVRKFGFRMMFDSRMSSKIGWVMEVGMRPGIRYEVNEENRFSNGYLRIGVVFGLAIGGRKELDKASDK